MHWLVDKLDLYFCSRNFTLFSGSIDFVANAANVLELALPYCIDEWGGGSVICLFI
jgi:hypothetical protein